MLQTKIYILPQSFNEVHLRIRNIWKLFYFLIRLFSKRHIYHRCIQCQTYRPGLQESRQKPSNKVWFPKYTEKGKRRTFLYHRKYRERRESFNKSKTNLASITDEGTLPFFCRLVTAFSMSCFICSFACSKQCILFLLIFTAKLRIHAITL